MPTQVFWVHKSKTAGVAYEIPGHHVAWFMRGPMLAGTYVSVLRLKRTSIIILPETTLGFVSLSTVLLKTRVSFSENEAISIRADGCTVEIWAGWTNSATM